MKCKFIIGTLASLVINPVFATPKASDEASLQQAIAAANADASIHKITFKKDARITLSQPVIYNGTQDLTIIGHQAVIEGSHAGSFVLDNDMTATTEDGSLIFNTAANISINNLSVINSATRGMVFNIPKEATGHDMEINLHKVTVKGSALYGLHVDDNQNAFDDGNSGSAIGIELNISSSSFTDNGTGAIDFDGIRVDERGAGSIKAIITRTSIDHNGGDGIELDEGGTGNVEVMMFLGSVSDNGFYNAADLDDGFDIDETDAGNIETLMYGVKIENNREQGLDFDESGNGNIELTLHDIESLNNKAEGIKLDEEDAGSIEAILKNVTVADGRDDGIQFTESGEGKIEASLQQVTATGNAKYGIKIKQWLLEDEPEPAEKAGNLRIRNLTLQNNGKGDKIKTNNISIK